MKTLLVVHKTHLDVGFTHLAETVVDTYLDHFIPGAIERAREMNAEAEAPRFVWTTGAWIIWKALHHYEGARLRALRDAIERGWIAWHGLPFTFHTELLTPNLLRLAMKFSQWLDAEFGRETVSAKMTDVPGHTIGLVPILAEAGIRYLHLGVNPASKVPEVPEVFRWCCGEAEILVNYARTYGSATLVEGCDTGLTFHHTNDNLGPPSRESIDQEEAWLQARYRPEQVRSGTMDEFADALEPLRHGLPVVEQEIGDSWIHGAASDPAKLADYATLRRIVEARADGLRDGSLPEISAWLEPLLLLPEHTWGLDVKAWFGDHKHYRPSELAELRRSHRYRTLEQCWEEQRRYFHQARENLPPSWTEAEGVIQETRNTRRRSEPALGGESLDVSAGMTAGRWAIRFEPATGSLAQLFDTETGRDLCPAEGRLGWGIFHYQLYGREDYRSFFRDYIGPPPYPWWAREDFGKLGLPPELERGPSATLRFGGGQVVRADETTTIRTELQLLGEGIVLEGAPEEIALCWRFHHNEPQIDLHIGWDRKAATRFPESGWLGFRLPEGVMDVHYRKLGQWIDPAQVVAGGGRSLHAIEDAIRIGLGTEPAALTFTSLDALLVAPDQPKALVVPRESPGGRSAVWFNLFNNLWNTNFPLWNGGPAGYRFRIRLG